MAGPTLNIKLRCGSWQQLATIYKRDLSRGAMFLKASSQPPIGTTVRIDLELPSATVVELIGAIAEHVAESDRGKGVELKLDPLPTQTLWLIENALASRGSASNNARPESEPTTPAVTEGQDVAAAESELVRALEAEAESLKRLNPFLVLGVSYDTNDAEVRAAFGELTKRYHPDLYARYQSSRLRQVAAEIFILIRDAYRKLAEESTRTQTRSTLGVGSPNARPQGPGRPPGGPPRPPPKQAAAPQQPAPQQPAPQQPAPQQPAPQQPAPQQPAPQQPAPQQPAAKQAVASQAANAPVPARAPKVSPPGASRDGAKPADTRAAITGDPAGNARTSSAGDDGLDALIDAGKLEDALAGYRALTKKNPQDRVGRAGIELVEGFKSLQARDRLEAAQRFEAALEIDPSNERAARELAEMRRQATNERKGLLSRLMGKKEGEP